MSRPAGTRGLFLGRFQPFHAGHLEVVRAIRGHWPKEELLVAIGSSQSSYTPENPFTAAERFEMIDGALREAGVEGYLILPISDVGRHAVWVAHVEELLPKFGRVHTNSPLTKALFERAGYPVESPAWVQRSKWEGRRIREALRTGAPWEEAVPPAVARYLISIDAPGRLRMAGPEPPARDDP